MSGIESYNDDDLHVIPAAVARLLKRGWACLDCAGDYGCQAGGRDCEVCSPPRNPRPKPGPGWDDDL